MSKETQTAKAHKEFTVTHADIIYPERKETTRFYEHTIADGAVLLFEHDPDNWTVFRSPITEEWKADYKKPYEDALVLSLHNIEAIDPNWTEELVAEVEAEYVPGNQHFILPDEMDELLEDTIDVTIWEKPEWEAHVNDR